MTASSSGVKVAVVGGGWAGLAAAVEGVRLGHEVTLFEMSAQLGGRARAVTIEGLVLDNGQHILIGAYRDTLGLMRELGIDPDDAFVRTPLRISDPDGLGLHLDAGTPMLAFAKAAIGRRGWRMSDRIALLAAAAGWAARRFECPPSTTVAALTARLPANVREQFIDPLCVAALNTPSSEASASVFLRVLKDALFSGPGSADLLLPRISLSALLPEPALRWLGDSGVDVRFHHRAQSLTRVQNDWSLDGERFDRIVLATTPNEASRIVGPIAAPWSAAAASLRFEPIVTVYLHAEGTRLPEAMLALKSDEKFPAQFVFDRGRLGGPPGLLAFVISGARAWVERGSEATVDATMQQARAALALQLRGGLEPFQTITEKRATFRCTPDLVRPSMRIAAGLNAAGDYVEGPYPATLEGAVRSGLKAVRSLG